MKGKLVKKKSARQYLIDNKKPKKIIGKGKLVKKKKTPKAFTITV